MLFSLRKFHLSVHIHVLNFVHMFLFDCLSPFYVLCHVCSSFMEEIKNTTVFFLIGRFKRVTLTPSFARNVSDAFKIVIMTAINCCFNKYDHLLHVYQIKRARIQRALRMCDNF